MTTTRNRWHDRWHTWVLPFFFLPGSLGLLTSSSTGSEGIGQAVVCPRRGTLHTSRVRKCDARNSLRPVWLPSNPIIRNSKSICGNDGSFAFGSIWLIVRDMCVRQQMIRMTHQHVARAPGKNTPVSKRPCRRPIRKTHGRNHRLCTCLAAFLYRSLCLGRANSGNRTRLPAKGIPTARVQF